MISVFDRQNDRDATLVQIDGLGRATAFSGHVDLGTGIETALAQIVAEELDLPLSAVHVVLGDTALTPDQGPTIASETIQITAIPLRQAAAQIRWQILALAARQINLDPGSLMTAAGCVLVPDGRQIPYADLLCDTDLTLRLDPQVPVKDPSAYRLVGQPVGRRDLPAKVRGDFAFVHDLHLDGMLHAHVIRPPYAGRDSGAFVGRSLLGYDEAAIAGRPGFVAIVHEADFLAVVAETAEAAQHLAEALPVRWVMPPELPPLADVRHALKSAPSTPRVLDTAGQYDAAMAQSHHQLERTYVWPWHLHGSIGPSCAVADWADGQPVIYSGTQNPHMLREDLAKLVGLAPGQIEIRRYQAAGCYGRNCADDVCGDALLASRAVGRPVRVQLTRAQENLWEPKGAAQLMEVRGGLDAAGSVTAYGMESWYPSNRGPNLALLLTGRIPAAPHHAKMGDRTIVPPYDIPNKRIICHDIAPLVRAAWMRGVSALPNTFAHESWMDEAAHQAGEDPVAYRLRHLSDPRAADLIRRSAEAAGWEPRRSPRLRRQGRMAYGQGFAYATYVHGPFPGTAAAAATWICDVAVDTETGEVTLTQVFVGQDQGLVINPDGVRAQIHGNVIQTAHRTLREEVTFDRIAPTAQSWATYPLQRFDQVPAIQTLLIERPGDPALGVGESAAVPAAAAIANAIFDATGIRLREAPFTPERVRAALGKPDSAPAPALAPALAQRFSRRWRRALLALGGAVSLGAWALPIHAPIAPAAAPPASTFSAETLALGAQVFAAGDCAVCHTAPGGAPNAGGRAMHTPFGTIYTTNLTPDPETGLGLWSYEAFARAMRHGISRDGSNLYPAFPYTAFARITEPEMLALYAYLQTLAPVRAPTPRAQMTAPLHLRPLNAAWNLLFHDPTPFTPDPARPPEWNRGKYLVEAAGHCSACHTPRNALGAEIAKAAYTGALVDGWWAPPLTGPEAAARGWTEDRLYAYLRTGHGPGIASASGPMAEVVHSLQGVPDQDIRAMATYLETLAMAAPPRPTPATTPAATPTPAAQPLPGPGARIFQSACASCHEPGLTATATAAQVPLDKSAVLRAPTDAGLRHLLDHGIAPPLSLDLRDMPAFAGAFTPDQTAALTAWLRARYAPDLPPWR